MSVNKKIAIFSMIIIVLGFLGYMYIGFQSYVYQVEHLAGHSETIPWKDLEVKTDKWEVFFPETYKDDYTIDVLQGHDTEYTIDLSTQAGKAMPIEIKTGRRAFYSRENYKYGYFRVNVEAIKS